MAEMSKRYDAAAAQERWNTFWKDEGTFTAGQRPDAETFTVMNPPPNVTSILHMGHALNGVVQDVLVRWQRMLGKDVLWLPGTDHAGIATQAVVEKKIWREQKKTLKEIGREAFLKEVWDWKEHYGNAILEQNRALGCSCDWTRTAFTMDENLSRAVRVSFVQLWEKGLVYRGHRMVNWDCVLQSAIGKDEIEEKETKGHLWHFNYPLEDGSGHMTVATTRPETMLGDTAVAVHPDDDRYKALVGKNVRLPLMNRLIPIIADESVEMEFGTGVVKVTPGHDFNDNERGQRHNLPVLNIMNRDGTLNEEAGSYAGLSREDARKKVVADLDEQGFLEKVEDYTMRLPLSDRSKSVIEPLISEQWFVKMEGLAAPAIQAVKDGTLKFVPERWTKVYLDWLENVHDWCISRQLWWGHQIPVWYDEDGVPAASVKDLEIGAAHPKTGKPIVRRDEDVLDTWASSWLWPFSTLGWPDQTDDLARFYPTQFLSTAREIIYLWVARMVMAGYEFLGQCPFDKVYMHATVLDQQGRRMSKSLGNGIDPNEMIDQYGTDAVRFTLALLTTEGQDVKLATTKFELGRNFMNKIWNSARFVLMSVPEGSKPSAGLAEGTGDLADRWILSRLSATTADLTAGLGAFRYHDSAQAIYAFVWNDFCDWYLEASKPRLQAGDAACASTLLFVLDRIVHLIQPFTPYIAAELAEALGHDEPIALASWPEAGERDENAEADFGRLQETISAIRKIRNENRVDDKTNVDACIKTPAPELLMAQSELIQRLARVGTFAAATEMARPGLCATEVRGNDEIYVPLEGLIDVGEERARKQKELDKARGFAASIEKKLGNENFVSRAKPEIVERERERLVEAREKIAKLEQALKDLH